MNNFITTKLEEERNNTKDVFSVKINKDERLLLDKCKMVIEQPKDSTALKTLAWIGAKVILEEKTNYIISTLFKNKRNNERNNIHDFD